MKRYRGFFRLGRRLALAWRWPFRRRRRVKRCFRVDLANNAARFSHSATMTTKLFGWTRHLVRRLRRSKSDGGCYRRLEEDRDVGEDKKPPPKGFMAVYVGGKDDADGVRRYLVPVIYFNHPLFGELLREAELEFEFHQPGGITIPCPAAEFERVQSRVAGGGGSVRWKRAR